MRIAFAAWLIFLCPAGLANAAERTTITGKVTDSAGAALPNATVLIYKAGVKTGYSTYCPTCYIDCGKHAQTGPDGTFQIPGLSADLQFTLLVLHDGNATATLSKVDPDKGPIPVVALKPIVPVDDASRIVRGLVVDPQGKPLRGAVAELQGVIFASGAQQFGGPSFADFIAVTNDKGAFQMTGDKPAARMIITVAARGMAAKIFTESTGAERKTLTVEEGATVRGRLLYQGKPVHRAEVGLMAHNRRAGTGFPEVRIGTQDDGTFAITNVPAGRIWTAYPKMESLAERGVAGAAIDLETKDNGETVNVGDIELAPAFTMTGHVVLSDGKPLPAGMRITLSSDSGNDSQTMVLPADGAFVFAGLARGVYSLSPSVKGYALHEGYEQEVLVRQNRSVVVQLEAKTR